MPEIIQRSFTGGELAPALRSRSTISKYTNGLALCKNFETRAQGGVYSRSGLKFIGELEDQTKEARLIPFSFNTEQTYILVFEHLKIRIIKDGGYVLDGAGPAIYEVETVYTEEQLPRLVFTQSADVMTIVHPDHDVRNLSRFDHDDWTLAPVDYTSSVPAPEWIGSSVSTITNITQANPAVVTTSVDHGFVTGDAVFIQDVANMLQVNERGFTIVVLTPTTFQLANEDSTGHTAYGGLGTASVQPIVPIGEGAGDFKRTYNYVVTAVDQDGVESGKSQLQTISTPSLSVTAAIKLQWVSVTGAAYYRIYKDPSNGTGFYGWIGDSETNQFEDFNIAPLTSDAPPELRAPFNDLAGSITALDLSNLMFTSVGHNLVSGDVVTIEGLAAPTDFNGGEFPVQVVDADNFRILTDLAGPFSAYTSGGTFSRPGIKPSTVNYYQQRQVFGNTSASPQTIYTTQTGDFDSMRKSSPTRDTDAITFTISSREVNEIRHLVELDSLIVLTSGGEWRTTEGQDQVLTPSTIGVKKQSNNGASWVPPVVVNDTVIYVQDKGARVWDLNNEVSSDRFRGNDLSIMAEHLFEGREIREMAYADEPNGILWVVMQDGGLIGLTYQREHQVWAWHQHETEGNFESVATISEDGRDAVYFVVRRFVNGGTRRYVERFEPRTVTAPEDTFCVDSGLQYDGFAATTITGLSHLEGEDVTVVADGNEVTGLTVSGGAIVLPNGASKVTVGLGFTPCIETLDVDVASAAESLRAREISIAKVIIEVLDSRGGWVGPKNEDGTTGTMTEIKPRFDADGYGALPLKTFKQEVIIDPQWSKSGGLRIEQRAPMPLAILSIIPDVSVG